MDSGAVQRARKELVAGDLPPRQQHRPAVLLVDRRGCGPAGHDGDQIRHGELRQTIVELEPAD